jgi:hypothetical protein
MMGVKVYYQFARGASLYSGAGAYKALIHVEEALNGRIAPKTKSWRKEITPLFERLCASFGRGSVGDLSMVKTRNPKKFGVYMGKKAKKKKLEVRPVRQAVPRPTWAQIATDEPEGLLTAAQINEAARELQLVQHERELRAMVDDQAQQLGWGGALGRQQNAAPMPVAQGGWRMAAAPDDVVIGIVRRGQ